MRAIEHSFQETPPRRLFLDTDFLIGALVATETHHARCAGFVRLLHDSGLTTLYISALTWAEYIDVVTRQNFRDRLTPEVQEQFRLHDWGQQLVRESYVQGMSKPFEVLLRQFDWCEIPITSAVREKAVHYMGEYNLRAQDALHLAAMLHAQVYDIASFDEKFRRVEGLHLWNDRIYDH